MDKEFITDIWLSNAVTWQHLFAGLFVLSLPLWLPVSGKVTGTAGIVIGFVGGFEVCMAVIYPMCEWSLDELERLQ